MTKLLHVALRNDFKMWGNFKIIVTLSTNCHCLVELNESLEIFIWPLRELSWGQCLKLFSFKRSRIQRVWKLRVTILSIQHKLKDSYQGISQSPENISDTLDRARFNRWNNLVQGPFLETQIRDYLYLFSLNNAPKHPF